jgi:glycosyltransferase involved in cell wall biosynthesis
LKILHTEASCGWGGQEIRILEEASGIIARGHEVAIACPPHARLASEAERYGVPVIPLPIEFKTFAGIYAVRRHIGAHAYDVINTHSSADSWLVALACATLTRPPALVRTRHISAPVSGNFANRWLYHRANHIVTTGNSLRQHLIDVLGLDPNRVSSIATGVDTKRFAPAIDRSVAKAAVGLDARHRHIGIVATLRSWKGHLILLQAFSCLKRSDLRLVIVGDGPMNEQIVDATSALGVADRVIMAGQRSDPERWLQAMDIFCLPSYANEGVPQALMQAMSTGLPVISTPVGAIGEIVRDQDTGILVPPRNVQALAEAMMALIEDPTLAGRLGTAAYSFASRHFGAEQMVCQMAAVFAQASGTRQSSV